MYPILGRLPNILIYSYTVVWAVTILLTAGWLFWQARQRPEISGWFDGLLYTITGAVIGGRAAFVWLNQPYFAEAPNETWRFYEGGLNYYGALYGGLLLFGLWCLLTRRPFGRYAVLLAPAVVLAHAAGWLACLLEGCAYGATTFISWYAADLPDSYGVYAVRYQNQLAGILLCLLIWLITIRWLPHDGRRLGIALFALSVAYGAITFFRGDEMLMVSNLRLDTLLAAATAVLALLYTFFVSVYQNQRETLVQ